ncbi:MAG: hypothetical protein AAGC85_07785, partial [Bacteroidota bacterium]
QIQNEGEVYESKTDGRIKTIDKIPGDPLIPLNMLGYSTGIGIQRNIDYKRIISLELRFNQFLGNKRSMQESRFNVLIGFSL